MKIPRSTDREGFILAKEERIAILFIAGIFANFVISLINGILGLINRSPWQGTLCAYYGALVLLKLAILFRGSRVSNKVQARRWYLYTSVAILLLDFVLGGMVYLMATDQGKKHYPGVWIYGVAFYAFCKITAAAVNLIRARRQRAPVMMAIRSIGMVDALVSILMLEIALIDTFGEIQTPWARGMMASSGTGAWLIAAGIGVSGILWYRGGGHRMRK